MAKYHIHYSQMAFDFPSEDNDFDVIEEDVFLNGNIQNIALMLPQLYDTQHEDVARAEKRFEQGKGYLFTNGTGTGKTYVGCGIAYRFYVQNKRNILIVVPTEKKCTDWVEDGANINLPIYQLQETSDCGTDVVVTTYANFYQNNSLNSRHWDLIIYDESHYLNQNQQGNYTVYYDQHKKLANVPSAAREKVSNRIDYLRPMDYSSPTFFEDRKRYEEEHLKLTTELVEHTKVVFLSATPFAYHKSIQYADGVLFDIGEKIIEDKNSHSSGYNDPNEYQSFMIHHFGYQMKVNKLTIPESGVDVNLLERNFFETFMEKGVMSTRVLQLDYDYSRHFITVDSDIGDFISSGMDLVYESSFREKYKLLSEIWSKKYNYNYVNQLLETIKAKDIHTRIRKHLDLNRKVVIFHNYNHSAIEHPFRFDLDKLLTQDTMYQKRKLDYEIEQFEEEYPQYYNLDLSGLLNTRDAILKHFPYARQYNGTINKKLRSKYIDDFNDDLSGTNILLVQIKAGKEGISLHDKRGNYQRVLINLGLPTAPTEAIQSEGRIYREGLRSNAIYEYITLQTNFERWAFGQKIAERSRTAENLAMGNLARDLETSFKEGYIESDYMEPNLEQGTGGKAKDQFSFTISDFDKSKTYYYSRAKRNAKNKAKEGIDYFATPEPLGMKIIDWLNPKPDEQGLEPSAGHGAISRFFPGNTTNHFIEPSIALSSELSINSPGTVKVDRFENHSIINKYQFIAMNPPFGSSGKTAMDHVAKACTKHSGKNFRLIAIIPGGPAMDKRMEQFFESEEGRNFHKLWEIYLPSCTFERAGTSVQCKIVKIVHWHPLLEEHQLKILDLSYIESVTEFFDVIENLEM